MPPSRRFLNDIHPEARVDGFTVHDGTILFFGFVWGCIFRSALGEVLDYGAGRGAFYYENTADRGSLFRKHLQTLQNTGARVVACDVDDVVLEHPCADERVCIDPGKPLPFADERFSVIVSDHTFEHIENPKFAAAEMLRVLRPGGYICVRTPSRYGYIALISALVPNRSHKAVLRYAQADRLAEDVFPTRYKLNTLSQVRAAFPDCQISHYFVSGEPSYAFGGVLIYRAIRLLHRILPGRLNTSLCLFIRKPTV